MLIDSHAHIDLPDFEEDRDQVLARAREQGVKAIINVGLDAKSSRKSLEMARRYDGVFVAVGFHPHEASKMTEEDLKLLANLAEDSKVVAIGEIGLDFYRNLSPRQHQLEVFQQQLTLATELGLPVVIHCRQAHKEVFNILTAWVKSTLSSVDSSRKRGVIHCFSGDVEMARRYIDLGFVVSLAGSVTYPSAVELVEVARQLSLDSLLLETDSPFLAPQLYRGKRNEPAYISLTADKIAQIRQAPTEVVAQAAAQNAISLFRLPIS